MAKKQSVVNRNSAVYQAIESVGKVSHDSEGNVVCRSFSMDEVSLAVSKVEDELAKKNAKPIAKIEAEIAKVADAAWAIKEVALKANKKNQEGAYKITATWKAKAKELNIPIKCFDSNGRLSVKKVASSYTKDTFQPILDAYNNKYVPFVSTEIPKLVKKYTMTAEENEAIDEFNSLAHQMNTLIAQKQQLLGY